MKTQSPAFPLAVAQSLCQPHDIEGNLTRMEPLVEQAAAGGARLVLFSECGVTGYTADSPRIFAGDDAYKRLQRMAEHRGIVIVAGFLEQDREGIRNTQGVFYPDGRVILQHKTRPAAVEGGISGFVPGDGKQIVFEVEGLRCAIVICADTGIPDLYPNLAHDGVQLILIPTAGCGPRHLGYTEASLEDDLVFQRYLVDAESVVFSRDGISNCRAYRLAMASCNHMADNGVDYFHPGHSMIVGASGELAALIPGSFVFEHLRPRLAIGSIHPETPRIPGNRNG